MLQDYTLIRDLGAHEGKSVTLRGWVYHKRDIGKIRFVVIQIGRASCRERV